MRLITFNYDFHCRHASDRANLLYKLRWCSRPHSSPSLDLIFSWHRGPKDTQSLIFLRIHSFDGHACIMHLLTVNKRHQRAQHRKKRSTWHTSCWKVRSTHATGLNFLYLYFRKKILSTSKFDHIIAIIIKNYHMDLFSYFYVIWLYWKLL